MVIYGRHPLREALRAGFTPKVVYVADGAKLDGELQWLLKESGVPLRTLPRAHLTQIAHSPDHQGVAADIGEFPIAPLREVLQRAMEVNGVVLGLDHLQDPRNVGSLIRSAEALGACGVVLPSVRSVGVTPAVVKASAGACFHIPIAMGNLRQFAKRFEDAGGFVAVLDMDGDDIRAAPKLRPLLLIVGAEGEGVSASLKAMAHAVWRIPMAGRVAALNAAVAGAIALWEVTHRHA
ncbi:Putative TrmH family tRNA/rRNA methyltransferase [bacterium HR17]|uniref:TrmH family tRNA/rRNA methyltransferase n=1 Tax=Candidatus Fervidibacter japonicus TaxID=2035412 RepID=A0A2H5X978_9BACT|nr:Putative TrmH family tRNA/rRNA methyltransferase [bacterium HR17]